MLKSQVWKLQSAAGDVIALCRLSGRILTGLPARLLRSLRPFHPTTAAMWSPVTGRHCSAAYPLMGAPVLSSRATRSQPPSRTWTFSSRREPVNVNGGVSKNPPSGPASTETNPSSLLTKRLYTLRFCALMRFSSFDSLCFSGEPLKYCHSSLPRRMMPWPMYSDPESNSPGSPSGTKGTRSGHVQWIPSRLTASRMSRVSESCW